MSRCRRIRAGIVRSVDGELEPAEALLLARHLETCTGCRIVHARESRLAEILAGIGDPCGVDESFFRAVMASLPELPPKPAVEVSRKARWRRGLRLAAFATFLALGAGFADRVAPLLRLDIVAPALPRFAQDDTGGWISSIGSAAQWIRLVAQSIGVAASSAGFGTVTISVLVSCAFIGAVAIVAVSGALAWAARADSRLS
jgi:anti-sigma factor RsiW